MNLLVFVPAHPVYGLRPQTWASLAELQRQSPVGDLLELVISFTRYHWFPFADVTAKYSWARSLVLEGGYDALLTVEADMIVPVEAAASLWGVDADVAYGLYCHRTVKHHRWSFFKEVTAFGGISYSVESADVKRAWGSVVDVAGVGLGCTLIRRRVLEQLDFRLMDGREGNFSCDWTFALDCQAQGFSQRGAASVLCGHVTELGVLWPVPQHPYYVEV